MNKYKYNKECFCCENIFSTNYPFKKYCGADECELYRRKLKSRRIEVNRRGKRKEEKKAYYLRNRKRILDILEFCKRKFSGAEVLNNFRGLFEDNRELDIFIPEKNLAIEYCGLYWHSEISGGKDRRYHYQKMVDCNKKDVRLITIFEDEFLNRPEVVLSRIENALGLVENKIFARKCQVVEVDKKKARSFLERYHLQGKSNAKICFGLEFEGVLLQLMTFGHPARNHTSSGKKIIEMKRMVNLPGYSVVGGASRLLKSGVIWAKENNYNQIKSYCDMRWANQQQPVYEKLGFILKTKTKYTPHYIKGQKRYRNQSLRKTPEERETGKTEWELRKEQGFDRIWDCGHRTYVLEI